MLPTLRSISLRNSALLPAGRVAILKSNHINLPRRWNAEAATTRDAAAKEMTATTAKSKGPENRTQYGAKGKTVPMERKEYADLPATRYDAIGVLSELINGHPIVLFMKGTPDAPRCGHSLKAVEAIARTGLKHYVVVDVLQSSVVRSTLKELAGCKTVPQLFVKGHFLGDASKVAEMEASGELAQVFKESCADTHTE